MEAETVYLSRPWIAHYPRGVPADPAIPPVTVPELFEERARRYAGQTAINFYGTRIRYAELREQVNRCAAALHALGVRRGDRVGLYLLNTPEFVISYLAVLRLGAVVTPISPVYTSLEVRHQLADSGARAVICQDILYDNVVKTGVPLDQVVVTGIADYLPWARKALGRSILSKVARDVEIPRVEVRTGPGVQRFPDLLRRYPPDPPAARVDPADLAVLPYTGGTTGPPKGAMLTHANLVAAWEQCVRFWPVLEEGGERVIAFLPFYHIYGQVVVMLTTLLLGGTLVLFTTLDLDDVVDALDLHRATLLHGVPTFFEYMKEHPKTGLAGWRRLKLIVSGADTLHETTVRLWEERTGSVIHEGYGLTETTSISHANPLGRRKVGSFGVPMPGMGAVVVDPDSGEVVPPGEVGELLLSGPNVMQGYWNRPAETAEALVELAGRRWLRTGDLVRMDEEGYFFFYDRKKDMIKYKGYSVFAREVEDYLYQHPHVKAAAVIGVPDRTAGQVVKAIVVLQKEARGKVSEEDILEYCRRGLAHYKVPRIVEFRGELPQTDVGKISRRELREEVEEP